MHLAMAIDGREMLCFVDIKDGGTTWRTFWDGHLSTTTHTIWSMQRWVCLHPVHSYQGMTSCCWLFTVGCGLLPLLPATCSTLWFELRRYWRGRAALSLCCSTSLHIYYFPRDIPFTSIHMATWSISRTELMMYMSRQRSIYILNAALVTTLVLVPSLLYNNMQHTSVAFRPQTDHRKINFDETWIVWAR